jgi:deoxyribodipyrimidine photolyase
VTPRHQAGTRLPQTTSQSSSHSAAGKDVPEVTLFAPGEDAGREMLVGSKNGFLTKRLKGYAKNRNDPGSPEARVLRPACTVASVLALA